MDGRTKDRCLQTGQSSKEDPHVPKMPHPPIVHLHLHFNVTSISPSSRDGLIRLSTVYDPIADESYL
jgi:hypothetical protein